MKNLFKPDTQSALDKTRRKIADVEASIADPQAKRSEKLAQTDDVTEVLAVDKAIDAERAALEIYKSHIAV
jgi:hypothetical protein